MTPVGSTRSATVQVLQRMWLTTLLLAAVLLRSLVADGYMPDAGGVVRLCTPDGMMAVVIDPDTGEAVELDETRAIECPWSFAFFPGALLAAPPLMPVRHAAALSAPATARLPLAHESAGLPPARAPPVLPCCT